MYKGSLTLLAAVLYVLSDFTHAQRALGRYNIDKKGISTSGISSGGSMATQMHVAYSSYFMGVATFAGSPYYCARGNLLTALNACMTSPNSVNVATLVTATNSYADKGEIDPTSNMRNDRVYIWHGSRDTVVSPGQGPKIEEYYRNYVSPTSNIKTEFSIASGHAQPTLDYGNACTAEASPYINRCNFNGAYEALNWIYGGNLIRPSGNVPLPGDFYEFDQKEFFYISPPLLSSMDTSGYIYVPSGCTNAQTPCKLHVAYHGCLQGKYLIRDVFPRNTGYNEVGELNNIIILYPQAVNYGMNGNGCWDWWGYTVNFYATKGANQPLASIRMVDKLIGPNTGEPQPPEPPACGSPEVQEKPRFNPV